MILESKKLFFKKILIVLEDDKINDTINSGVYSSIIIISHVNLDLPNFKKRIKTTALIDLGKPKEDIFAKFNDTARNEIRKTEKLNNLEIVSKDNNFKEAYTLYKSFEYTQNRIPFDRVNLEKCLLFSAYYNKEIISGIFVDPCSKGLRIRYIFSKRLQTEDKELYRVIASATRRLLWEISVWGKDNGFYFLDLASVNFNNEKVANITKFKMSFGGDVVDEYTYTYKTFFYALVEKLVTIKNLLKKLFRV